jgi:hypothetical protein
VADVNFKLPAQLRCFGDEHKVDAEDFMTAFNTPSHHPPSPPVEALPSTLLRGIAHHHRHPPMPAEVDRNVDDPGSSAVSNDSAGNKDAGEFVVVDLDLEADRMTNAILSPGCH